MRYAALLIFLLSAAGSASAAAPARRDVIVSQGRGSLWVGIGTLSGDVTYRIGGRITDATGTALIYFPLSELNWPVNGPLASIGGEYRFAGALEAHGALSGTAAPYSGKVLDSDWTNVSNPQLKTIYSESDTKATGVTVDLGVRYWLDARRKSAGRRTVLRLGPGAGILYQRFYWDASNVDQWYPQNPELGHDRVSGPVGSYTASLSVPYAGLAASIEHPSFTILLGFDFSPGMTNVTSTDDHKLRFIRAEGDDTGDAYRLSAQGRLRFKKYWFVGVLAELLNVATSGQERNIVYGGADAGTSWTIDHKVESRQFSLSLEAGVRF